MKLEKNTPNGPVVFLGRGITADPNIIGRAAINIGSELNAIAASLLLEYENIPRVLLCGGKTEGMQYPSEAEVMKKYMTEMCQSPADRIEVESASIDTMGNIVEAIEKGFIQKNTSLPLVSVWQQLPRAKIYFKSIAGIKAQLRSSQGIIWKYGSSKHKSMLWGYIFSLGFTFEIVKEAGLLLIALFDRKGKGVRWIINFLNLRQGKTA